MSAAKSILVVGGAGCLGRAMLRKFALQGGAAATTISVDLASSANAAASVVISGGGGSTAVFAQGAADKVKAELESRGVHTVGTIVCTAGAWAGGSVNTTDGLTAIDSMWQANVKSAVTTAHLASQFLEPGGLLVFTGASAALGPTSGMAGYGMAKAATHQLASSMADSVGAEGGLPTGASVATLLPNVIDTPANRNAMPDADFGTWASPDGIADMVHEWALHGVGDSKRPSNGALLQLETEMSKTAAHVVEPATK